MRSRIAWAAAAAAAAIALVGAIPALLGRPSPDVAWFFYLADRMLDGERLYRDVVEVNPPLIVWLNLPVAALGRAAAVPMELVYGAALLGLIGVSLALAGRLLPEEGPWPAPGARHAALLLGLVVLLPLAGKDFGEREHLLLILTLPYTLLVIARAGGRSPGPSLALAVGVMAGVGFTLKPYFLPLWLALEAYLVRGRPSPPPWRRPEAVAVVGVALLYGAAVLLFAPEYFALARTFGSLYWSYLRGPLWLTALLGEGSALPLLALLAFGVLYRRDPGGHVWRVLALAVGTTLLSALLQGKGWRYHFYPAMGYGLLLLAAMGWGARRPLGSLAQQLYAAACVAAVVTASALALLQSGYRSTAPRAPRYDADPDFAALSRELRRQAPGGSVLVLSSNMASAFPLVTTDGLRWASRFPSLWLLPALYMSELRSDAPIRYREPSAMSPQERYLGEAVAEDMEAAAAGCAGRAAAGAGPARVRDSPARLSGVLQPRSTLSRRSRALRLRRRRGRVSALSAGRGDRSRAGFMARHAASGALAAGWDGARGIAVDRDALLGDVRC